MATSADGGQPATVAFEPTRGLAEGGTPRPLWHPAFFRLWHLLVKLGLLVWIAGVLLLFLVLFGPPEFWSILDRFGGSYSLRQLQGWLQPGLTAAYGQP